MSKEYFDEFEVCYENTHDEIITTQFKREGNRYLDRTVRRAYEVFKVQQQKIDEYILVSETLDELYVKEVEKNKEMRKKVDLALQFINTESEEIDLAEYRISGVFVDAKKLEQALKGK